MSVLELLTLKALSDSTTGDTPTGATSIGATAAPRGGGLGRPRRGGWCREWCKAWYLGTYRKEDVKDGEGERNK